MFNSESIYEYIREKLNQNRHLINRERVKAVKTSCLGQCAVGPNIFISPDNVWYTFTSTEDIDDLIRHHFIEGKTVERLINKGVNNALS